VFLYTGCPNKAANYRKNVLLEFECLSSKLNAKDESFMFLKKIVFEEVLKSFRRVLKSKNSLKS
jgi:hypothetical protein